MLLDFILLVLVSTFFFAIDQNRCGVGNGVLFLHHFLNTFINFAWLSGNMYTLVLFIFAPVVTLVHWHTNHGKCVLTEKHNELCGRSVDAPFNDFWNKTGLKRYGWWNHFGHYVFLGAIFLFALYKIRSRKLRRSFVF
jgi:hypothetical protein